MAQTGNNGPLHDLSAFQRDALAQIAREGGQIGLEVKEQMEHAYGTSQINHGRLYPNLDELVQRGLVEKRELDGRTNTYEITDRGRRELRAHVSWQRSGLKA